MASEPTHLTMQDVADRWQVPLKTAYKYVADVERAYPLVIFYGKRGRHRRFTEAHMSG